MIHHRHSALVALIFGLAAPLLIVGCADGGSDEVRPARAAAVADSGAPLRFRVPTESDIPPGPLGVSVRRGRAILLATRDSLGGHVGNNLRCTSCHLDAGTRPNAVPLVGAYVRFPRYVPRSGVVGSIESRVNDCFERSLNGRALPADGRDMRDIVAYLAFLSLGVAPPGRVAGQGLATIPPLAGDTARGAALYGTACASCHGADGAGTPAAPALWGAQSFNVGASMARVASAAAFIRHNMPYDRAGSLTDQQAFDVAAFVNAHRRPDLRGKEHDWPNGDAPADVPYETKGARGGSARR